MFACYFFFQLGIEILKLILQKDEDVFIKVTFGKINPETFYDKYLRKSFDRYRNYVEEKQKTKYKTEELPSSRDEPLGPEDVIVE